MSDESGHELRENNEQIVKLINYLKRQRMEMNYLIEKQEEEKLRIQNEIEKLSFKLTLLIKSLNQRLTARVNYDRTIQEIENNYTNLVEESGKLLFHINKEVNQLDQIMDKKTETIMTATVTLPEITQPAKQDRPEKQEKVEIQQPVRQVRPEKVEIPQPVKQIRPEKVEITPPVKQIRPEKVEIPQEEVISDKEETAAQPESPQTKSEKSEASNNSSRRNSQNSHPNGKEEEQQEYYEDEYDFLEEYERQQSPAAEFVSKMSETNPKTESQDGSNRSQSESNESESTEAEREMPKRRRSSSIRVIKKSDSAKRPVTRIDEVEEKPHSAKPKKVVDDEVQSFRDAYGRQHTIPTPPPASKRVDRSYAISDNKKQSRNNDDSFRER